METASFDLHNLCVKAPGILLQHGEDDVRKGVAEAGMKLIDKIFNLPVEDSEYGPLVSLPEADGKNKLPRAKHIPEPKPETKWEKFAKEKGIKKTKKERMVYDEEQGIYRPRYGYKSIKSGLDDQPIVEVKNGDDPYADPWAASKKEKKTNRDNNLKKQLKNQEGNERRAGRGVKKSQESQNDVLPMGELRNSASNKKSKGELKKLLQQTQKSTASMGTFDHLQKGEPAVKKLTGKKRAYRDNSSSVSEENAMMKSKFRAIADQVVKKAKKVSNSLKDYEGILPDKVSNVKFKKGGTKIGTATKGKGKKGSK